MRDPFLMKEVSRQNLWKFELGSQENINFPIRIMIGFHQQDRGDFQILNNDTFCRVPVTSCQCIIGTEKYPHAGILFNYDDDDDGYSQGYGQIKETIRALTRGDILQPYIRDTEFRSSNVRADDVGYNSYFFNIQYQQKFTNS